jgi:ligand-binding SRPBCC domain-containing protein
MIQYYNPRINPVVSLKSLFIKIKRKGMYTLIREQYLDTTISEAWDFLKNPANLNQITPEDLRFQIVSDIPDVMFNGLIIEYRIHIPVIGKRKWVAEIKHIRERHSFVDEQRIGPYKFWYHYHELIPENDKIKVIDRVYYEVPYWIFGKILNALFIRRTLRRIFDYRKEKVSVYFNKK